MDNLFLFLDDNPIISISVFAIVQILIFAWTWIKLGNLGIFLPDDKWEKDFNFGKYSIKVPKGNDDLKKLVDEINQYITSNEGTTDFGIIKDKVERILESRYEDAVSTISYPTYFGLMGTFFGVFIGLEAFNIGINKEILDEAGNLVKAGVNDEIVSQLIGGVIVSMITSLVGLFLMIVGYSRANYIQKKVEKRKNLFYDFIQVNLMPSLGTSMVAALNRLHSTINSFEPAFQVVISGFKSAFNECTETLRGSFGENVSLLTNAVETMGQNMGLINRNVEIQEELLRTLQQEQTLRTLECFNSAALKFDSVTTSIGSLIEIKDAIATSSNAFVSAQSDFIEKMSIPERVFEKINAILTRISVFENSINALGENISQTQLLGNTQMNLIEEQISAISKKTKLALDYQDLADEELQKVFEAQTKTINLLNENYRAAISSHSDEFESTLKAVKNDMIRIVSECKSELEAKREEYTNSLKESFNVEALNVNFSYLEKLKTIDENISKLEVVFKDQAEVTNKIEAIKKAIEEIKETKTISFDRRTNVGNTALPGTASTAFVPATPRPVTVHYTSPKKDVSTMQNSERTQNEESSKTSFFGRIFRRKNEK